MFYDTLHRSGSDLDWRLLLHTRAADLRWTIACKFYTEFDDICAFWNFDVLQREIVWSSTFHTECIGRFSSCRWTVCALFLDRALDFWLRNCLNRSWCLRAYLWRDGCACAQRTFQTNRTSYSKYGRRTNSRFRSHQFPHCPLLFRCPHPGPSLCLHSQSLTRLIDCFRLVAAAIPSRWAVPLLKRSLSYSATAEFRIWFGSFRRSVIILEMT